ncbi:MAG: phosphate ABC transporter substrate-binding protein PstS [Thermoplasmata archaeon]
MSAPPAAPVASSSGGALMPPIKRSKSRAGIFALLAVLILVVAAVAVGYEENWFTASSSKPGTCSTGTTLQGNGAQIAIPLMDQWETSFQQQTSNQVNYPGAGSGTGITDFSEHPPLVDFAIADEPLTSADVAALPGTALTLPVTAGALAIIYNLPGVTGHVNLTGGIIADIYLGTITNWNDSAIRANNAGVDLPNATIDTVHRSDAAGTTYVLTNFLSDDSSAWNISGGGPGQGISISWPSAPMQTAAKGNSAVLSTVETTTYSIGYSDLTDLLLASTPPGYAAVQNPKGTFVVPTLASTASAISDKTATTALPASDGSWFNVSMVNAQGTEDYPLATFIYLYVYQAADKGYAPTLDKAQVLVQFVSWAITVGQTYSNSTGLYYVALPAAVVAIDQAGIQTMTFNGEAIPACG